MSVVDRATVAAVPFDGESPLRPRDSALRRHYLEQSLAHIPRLLGAVDRNPLRTTYGCFDRQFWHYRTADFPSEMYQEAVLPLVLAYCHALPNNRWHRASRLRELVIAGLRFSARSSHADGSCDDYYPYERALGAAVFSFGAALRAYALLELDDAEIQAWIHRRARWLIAHRETGCLSNHHALAAWTLWQAGQVAHCPEYTQAAEARVRELLSWQSHEGWFDEYDGADPGYQTVTIDALAAFRHAAGATWLDEPLARGVDFCRWFLHPDDSYAGEYGSRGTYQFYPRGMELLAPQLPAAAELADGFLRSVSTGRQACFDEDRLIAHRAGNCLEAYLVWSSHARQRSEPLPNRAAFPDAGLWVHRNIRAHTVVSTARGGIYKHFTAGQPPQSNAGIILELSDGRRVVSQWHTRDREVIYTESSETGLSATDVLQVRGLLHQARFEQLTPVKLILFRVLLVTIGRFWRSAIRYLLQRRLITAAPTLPIRHTRRFEFQPADTPSANLRVTDTLELLAPNLQVRRLVAGSDHQTAYVAITGVYQESALQPWQDLAALIPQLNRDRAVTWTSTL